MIDQVKVGCQQSNPFLSYIKTDGSDDNVDQTCYGSDMNTFYYLDSSRLSAPHVALLSLY